MKSEDWNKVIERRLELIKEVLATKGEEYAREDSFSQLKEVAVMSEVTPEQACWTALSKHLVSVRALVQDYAKGALPHKPMRPIIQEKIGDAICYLVILEGLFEERLSDKNE